MDGRGAHRRMRCQSLAVQYLSFPTTWFYSHCECRQSRKHTTLLFACGVVLDAGSEIMNEMTNALDSAVNLASAYPAQHYPHVDKSRDIFSRKNVAEKKLQHYCKHKNYLNFFFLLSVSAVHPDLWSTPYHPPSPYEHTEPSVKVRTWNSFEYSTDCEKRRAAISMGFQTSDEIGKNVY